MMSGRLASQLAARLCSDEAVDDCSQCLALVLLYKVAAAFDGDVRLTVSACAREEKCECGCKCMMMMMMAKTIIIIIIIITTIIIIIIIIIIITTTTTMTRLDGGA